MCVEGCNPIAQKEWDYPGPPPDRLYLEQVLLPELGKEGKYMLFVGVADYTSHYCSLVGKDVRFVTTDANLDQDEHGKPEFTYDFCSTYFPQEITTALRKKGEPFSKFDTIILNGVIGWGTNTNDQINQALANCSTLLRPGGKVLLGWNSPEYATHANMSDEAVITCALTEGFSTLPIEGDTVYSGSEDNKWSPILHPGYQHHRYALLEKPLFPKRRV